ncbi:MAG: alpha-2-macroglobulin, partial [Anaerolineae bacterium]|nr:alpha-2-macroglobulin [Anaerolineae bacterium]
MTYPNVLVLGYLNATKTAAPETQMRAESYVGTGYQRLLTFEAAGGGFALFGGGEANPFLSAYGLMQLNDMAAVYPVDRAVVERTAEWLLAHQVEDGSWRAADYRAGRGALGMTAFVTWALADAGYGKDPGLARALSYLRSDPGIGTDPYTLALVANALVAADPKGEATARALDRLANAAVRDEEGAHWSGEQTMMGGYGRTGAIESTALAVHALLRGGRHLPLAQEALSFIVRSKDSWGTWGSTQATIWSLKALVLSATIGDVRDARATVRVALDGGEAHEFEFTPENADVVRVLTFDDVEPGAHAVSLDLSGQGSLMHQVTAIYYLPWSEAPPEAEPAGLMQVEVSYDRTTLAVDDLVNVTVRARLTREGMARMVLLDLGIPPGFSVQAEDLSALVEKGLIARYDLTGRQIIIYVENFASEEMLAFSYRLRARFPMRVKTQPGAAYDYYNPEERSILEPTLMTV